MGDLDHRFVHRVGHRESVGVAEIRQWSGLGNLDRMFGENLLGWASETGLVEAGAHRDSSVLAVISRSALPLSMS